MRDELGELASQLGYWVVYRNWYGKVSFLIYRWDEQLPILRPVIPNGGRRTRVLGADQQPAAVAAEA